MGNYSNGPALLFGRGGQLQQRVRRCPSNDSTCSTLSSGSGSNDSNCSTLSSGSGSNDSNCSTLSSGSGSNAEKLRVLLVGPELSAGQGGHPWSWLSHRYCWWPVRPRAR